LRDERPKSLERKRLEIEVSFTTKATACLAPENQRPQYVAQRQRGGVEST
jgi:hypothetical protein